MSQTIRTAVAGAAGLGLFLACVAVGVGPLDACTGIRLKAADGAVVYGRTMEWGAFDLQSRVVVMPRGHACAGRTPDGKPGKTWKTEYGAVGLDALGLDILVDGVNEKGLAVGLFYHAGFAVYQRYEPDRPAETVAPTDVCLFLLTTCASTDEVRAAIAKVRVVAVVEPALGLTPPLHVMVTEPSGKSIVIEWLKGEMRIFEAPLGVLTNSPAYDWHQTNLRNYVNLSSTGWPDKKMDDLDFKPLGTGSGMIGLPGDFTPPSRFVRAVAFTQTARPTPTGPETIYELFRILDNFNLPLAPAANAEEAARLKGMRSSTIWTTGYDLKNRVMHYHTQNNRRVRKLDLGKIDFGTTKLIRLPMDKAKSQDMEEVTPSAAGR